MAGIADNEAVGPLLDSFTIEEVNGEYEVVEATYAAGVDNTGVAYIDIALDDAKVPQPGDPFDHPSLPANDPLFAEVICEDRKLRHAGFATDGRGVVFIECTFRRQPLKPRIVRGGAGLQQATTELLRDGTQAVVEYNGRQQGGELSVSKPTPGFEFEVIEMTDDPAQLADAWIGVTNSTAFMGRAPGEWMVADADYEVALRFQPGRTDRYRFRWRIEGNPDGWDPTAVYKDPEQGIIPADLVDGTGIKTFEYYDRSNLAALATVQRVYS